jgi:hypothetical protein
VHVRVAKAGQKGATREVRLSRIWADKGIKLGSRANRNKTAIADSDSRSSPAIGSQSLDVTPE